MGKVTGFKEWSRSDPAKRRVEKRLEDYQEFIAHRKEETVAQQGGRCMDCGVPFCHQGCPLGNLIPDWSDLVYANRWKEAIQRLHSTNNFPEFTGRLCPAPCEAACVLAINDEAVTIEQIEKEIVERAFAEGWIEPRPPKTRTGSSIAVVGSGPSGLAAAAQLNRAGHSVTVFEKADKVGGLLRYGIPDFKLEKWVIDRRIDLMKAEGVEFRTGVAVGSDIKWSDLRREYTAVVICIGAEQPRDLQVPGRELDGVHFAMSFLSQQNRRNAGLAIDGAEILATDKSVVILGGGDTGSDCLGTSHRQRAKTVRQIELLPEPPGQRLPENPWPQWPMVMRTSSSQSEGGERDFAVLTQSLSGEHGKVEKLHAVRIEFKTPEDGGRPQMVEIPDSEFALDVDLVLLAMGFLGPVTETLVEQLGVELTDRGNLKVDAHFRTSVDGVYSAGDASRGQSLIVWAIADGREAARVVDADLRKSEARLPTKGISQPFGGR